MRTIYVIVGGMIKTAQARIVGSIAEVNTPYGIVEIDVWYPTLSKAQGANHEQKKLRAPA
jgi:hypothetical protein